MRRRATSLASIALRARRVLIAFLALFTLFAGPAFVAPGVAVAAPAKANLIDLEDEVMCVVCGRPLSTSGGVAADDQREVIQGFIDDGLTKQQVKDRLVAEYGEDVLVRDRSLVAGAAPLLAALVGAGSIVLLLRRRRDGAARSGDDDDPSTTGDASSATDQTPRDTSAADDARIDAELAERG